MNPKLIKQGTVSDAMVMNVDFAPTLLDMANLNIPTEMQGKSFKNVFNDKTEYIRDAAYYHYYEYPIWHKVQPHYGIRTGRYKLIHFYYSMDEWELYDLKNDPQELNNIYGDANEALISDLKMKLANLKKEYKDDYSIKQMKSMTDTVIRRMYNEPSKLKK
jgi:arylsulfatase A-like enzyme